MRTPDALGRTPQHEDAHSNRTRILATARQKLRDDPDASLDNIARAAGASPGAPSTDTSPADMR